LPRDDVMSRICQTVGELVNGPQTAAAILLREGDDLRIVCHFGFGPDGPDVQRIPYQQSFARLVLERNSTGFLEDLSLRPDLVVAQPRSGAAIRSVLAAPLRVNGHAVGSLEAYSHDKRPWSEEQIAMVESLAAQTSISLQAAELFDRVEQGSSRCFRRSRSA
jgi:GAF domain-containing protein